MMEGISDKLAHLVIAIDGTASSGKGTLAKGVADIMNLDYLDTGRLYRIFAVEFVEKYSKNIAGNTEITLTEEEKKKTLLLLEENNPKYSTEEVGKAASILARSREVRAALLPMQRQFIQSSKRGAVLDGRDIASVVYPEATVKVFVTAHAFVRARRRFKQLKLYGNTRREMYKKIFFQLLQRDIMDSRRRVAPLVRVRDSLYLNNSHMDQKTTLYLLTEIIKTFL